MITVWDLDLLEFLALVAFIDAKRAERKAELEERKRREAADG